MLLKTAPVVQVLANTLVRNVSRVLMRVAICVTVLLRLTTMLSREAKLTPVKALGMSSVAN